MGFQIAGLSGTLAQVNGENELLVSADFQSQYVYAYGSPAQYGLGVVVLNPLSVSFPSSLPVTQDTSPWVVSGTVAVSSVTGTVAVTNAALSELSFTSYGSPATENLNVYVVNPLTATFTETQIGVTQVTSPWIVSGTVGVSGSVAVTGTFWQATQPVSIASPVAVTGTFWQATQPVSGTVAVSSVSGSVAVTGTFWQATQPVSDAVGDASLAAIEASLAGATYTEAGSPAVSSLNVNVVNPITATFTDTSIGVTQLTSPWIVSGTVAVSNFPASQAVTGTFWQATQPVSGTVAVSSVSGSVAVTGTFWQATQPVSGTVAVSSISGSVAVTGTFWQATQPVSGTVAVSSVSGSVAVTGTFWQTTQPVSGTVTVDQGTSPWLVQDSVLSTVGTTTSGSPAETGLNVYVLNEGPTSTTANSPASSSVTSTSSDILAANSYRLEVTITNTGTVVVYLGVNGKVPTATAYHYALSPCTTANDGTGGTYTSDIVKGQINAIVASASGTVCVTELTA